MPHSVVFAARHAVSSRAMPRIPPSMTVWTCVATGSPGRARRQTVAMNFGVPRFLRFLRCCRSLSRVESTLSTNNGGIHKRIDENRELLELLAASAPDFLLHHPWVLNWFRSQDEFLRRLAESPIAPRADRWRQPRPFPASDRAELTSLDAAAVREQRPR